MINQLLKIKQFDKHLKEWQAVHHNHARPKLGWIKTFRKTLGMTAQQFAQRLGVKRARVVQLEQAEIQDKVTLHTLKKAAAAMNCELIYAFIPKQSPHIKTLEDVIKQQARELATEKIERISHSMSLEAQSISKSKQIEQRDAYIKKLLTGSLKKLWEENK